MRRRGVLVYERGTWLALLAWSLASKTHVSLGHTGSLPSSTGLGVYSPDLQTLSSSSASPLPAWCSQSCFVSVRKHGTFLSLHLTGGTLCTGMVFLFCFLFFFHLKNTLIFASNNEQRKNVKKLTSAQ